VKIAVCADGTTMDSMVDSDFGHCQGWLLIDSETGACRPGDDRQAGAVQCAGAALVAQMARSGAEAVVIDHCGPGAFAALQAAGLRVYSAPGLSVREATDQLKRGVLPAVEAARCAHAGGGGCCHGR
jgi:predicted Fe-Mo cluster-binding NifX family protein